MRQSNRELIRKAFRDWVDIDSWQAPCAITLTLRQAIFVNGDNGCSRISITPVAASQNFRHFMNRLNRAAFGKAAQRYGKGLAVVPILEGTQDKRLHYHAIIDCPGRLHDQFQSEIVSHWQSTDWGYHQTDCQHGADHGWLDYITKFRDKSDFVASIDLMNLRLP
ncbi:hypothetical protein [Novosphingobium sp.]|uniref:rolling circle replication-associated protein n=1 Tax=Novosphingobium sp. TaxID=1874826 RepID=UPI0022C4FB75|nr:hypothetical protein [Novosphingobium sp.]MCZ8018670.1 hypothetical protein [Novosphingobium sp.]MCZ8034675.1 hypothetical protein [Novosphingobium sp.]MCZ8052810.1 hypothetical protein [Novosphingobium sp.]MCZ8060568.1 hypothetical protein [Novosphingobium sp.]MCZ8230594.1 hypothetical protein [Novosphingobium sp.]